MTNFRQWLEDLQKEVLESRSFTPLSNRYGSLKLILDIIEVNGRFNYQLEILNKNLSLGLDADVNYQEWSNRDIWHLPEGVDLSKASPCCDLSILPTSLPEQVKFITNIDNDATLLAAVEDLCKTLENIHNTISQVHSAAKYAAFFSDLKGSYDVTMAKGEFTHWRDHEVIGALTLEKLKEKQTLYISDLLSSEFFVYMEKRCTTHERELYCQEIDMELLQDGIHDPHAVTRSYACFHQLFYLNGDLFHQMADEIVGKYIFEHRKALKVEQINSFFKFLYLLECVQQEISNLSAQKGLVFPPGFDQAATIFHENLDVRRICITLYDLKQKEPLKKKKPWFVVYKFFADYGWLTDTMQSHFFQFINLIFPDISLSKQDFKEVDSYYKTEHISKWTYNKKSPQQNYTEFDTAATLMKTQFIQSVFLKTGRRGF